MLGLFPGMLAVASVLGLLQGLLGREVARQAEDTIVRLLQEVLKGNNAGVVDGARRLFAQDRPGVFTAGAVAALVPTVRAVLALIRALEIAYGRLPGIQVAARARRPLGPDRVREQGQERGHDVGFGQGKSTGSGHGDLAGVDWVRVVAHIICLAARACG